MSADELRKAAETLRERATAATNVTGASDWFMECRGMHFIGEYGVRSSGGFVAGDTVEEEAEYISTMSPDLGMWLAALLGMMADHATGRGNVCGSCVQYGEGIARLINGGAS